METSRWSGRVAVVTGAGAGIGAATCLELSRLGVTTIGLARRIDRVQALRFCLPADKQPSFHAMQCDIANEADVVRTFSEIEQQFGGVDVLVNNAGVMPHTTLLQEDNSADMQRVMNTNVLGVVNCTREALKSMRKRSEGHVFHINSISGHVMPFHSESGTFGIYHASKYAVTALAEQHRQEFIKEKLNIRVTSISPSAVATECLSEAPAEGIEFLAAKDVADAIIYALETPSNVVITELTMRPMNDTY